ncbi:MAG: stage III sporulation protein AB [Oscillospiraceae bacterium]|nr:stage III sporulation protein AB [Oscillospiraceae bacterium]
MEHLLAIMQLFPPKLRDALGREIDAMGGAPEEIRLRVGSPICLRQYGREYFCLQPFTKEEMLWVVGNAADGSYHTAARFLQKGYLPLPYGSRMGLCGSGGNGRLSSFGDVSSACIRVARSVEGCGDQLYDDLYRDGFRNTIIIAPPGAGKTTLLRELIRKLSDGGMYMGVADERGEISGMYRDKPSFELGPRTDVLSGVPKQQSGLMLLRTMTPDVLAMDEITAYGDSAAIMEASGCGAGLLTTVHGESIRVLLKSEFRQIYEMGVFRYGILITVQNGKRMYKAVDLYDEAVWSGAYNGSGVYAGRNASAANVGTYSYAKQI